MQDCEMAFGPGEESDEDSKSQTDLFEDDLTDAIMGQTEECESSEDSTGDEE